jgi:RHH-type transcriptional regulator, rel operon repressor / antitoxin RelB
MTLRLDEETLERLDALASATDRSKAWLAAQAVRDFLETNEWQIQAIASAVKEADSPNARFIEHDKVKQWLSSWGTPRERKPPL